MAEEAAAQEPIDEGVDWGDEGGGEGGGEEPLEVPLPQGAEGAEFDASYDAATEGSTEEEYTEEEYAEPVVDSSALNVGDLVTSSEDESLGVGTIIAINADSEGTSLYEVQWADGTTANVYGDALVKKAEDAESTEETMEGLYLLGVDVLGGDMGTGGAPSAPMDYGPSMSSGTVYTDYNTILAAQKALLAKGISPGKIDGLWGNDTEAALFKFSGKHGPPDDDTLTKLGVKPGAPTVTRPSSGGGMTFLAPKPPAAPQVSGPMFWSKPLWSGSTIPRWRGAIAGGGAIALLTGLTLAVTVRR
ncbi:MAG: hypothetical protein UY96_C0003G0006 [Parcubacteria group bacterium GW2011_GWB1_56_8]|nr:MAG: hypothetical protein UY96_C0003G0006 [Parcubacteria group bacterium GW2011_GWB1_56_8]